MHEPAQGRPATSRVRKWAGAIALAAFAASPLLVPTQSANAAIRAAPMEKSCSGLPVCRAAQLTPDTPAVNNFGWDFNAPGAVSSDGTHVWVVEEAFDTLVELDA